MFLELNAVATETTTTTNNHCPVSIFKADDHGAGEM